MTQSADQRFGAASIDGIDILATETDCKVTITNRRRRACLVSGHHDRNLSRLIAGYRRQIGAWSGLRDIHNPIADFPGLDREKVCRLV